MVSHILPQAIQNTDFIDPVISSFFGSYAHPLNSQLFRRLLTPCLNNTRSSNATTRAASADLFKSIIGKTSEEEDVQFALDEILSLPKASKTSGAEHRTALYTMLGSLSPSLKISPALVQSALPLLAKETHDAAILALAESVIPHLVFSLQEGSPLPSETTSLIAKGMNDAKPPVRRAFCLLIGNALWQLGSVSSDSAQALVKSILPSFDTNLKTVTSSPTSLPAGPLEGYIATAVLLGPVLRGGKFGKLKPLALHPDRTNACSRRFGLAQLVPTRHSGSWSQALIPSLGQSLPKA